jgi:cyclic pyranopterin phosphate synthase
MKDSFDREIDYLRVSLTDRCNLRCEYCMPESGIDNKMKHSDMLSIEEMYRLIQEFVSLGIKKIRFTGGEPLVRQGAIHLIKRVNELEKVEEVTITTNGVLLEDYAESLMDAGVKRINISLDTLNPEKYEEITRGGDIKKVLRGIEKAQSIEISPIKINTVLIGGFNDDEIEDLVNLTLYENIDVRFIELMPVGEAALFAKSKFYTNTVVLEKVPELVSVRKEDISSPANYYKLPDAKGRVGLINPITCKFCKDCNRVRLTATGKLKLCLHSDREIDLGKVLREGGDLNSAVREAILTKEEEHQLENKQYIKRSMNQIGG